MGTKSVAFKIVLYSTICVMLVGVFSNLYLYFYLQKRINDKAAAIDALYLETLQTGINLALSDCTELALICANDAYSERAMSYLSFGSTPAKRALIGAQDMLNFYLRASSVSRYVTKLMLFNSEVMVQASTPYTGQLSDLLAVQERLARQPVGRFSLSQSIDSTSGLCLSLFLPAPSPRFESYLYLELSPAIVSDPLTPYLSANAVFAVSDGQPLSPLPLPLTMEDLEALPMQTGSTSSDSLLTLSDGRVYQVTASPIELPGGYVYNCVDVSTLRLDNQKMLYTLLVVLCSVLLVSLGIMVIMVSYVTRPIKRLIGRIQRISENDFSYDHSIEESTDEIGQIGRVVNEMTMSITNLLSQNDQMHEQRQEIEMALLQSQVNPHFLYNTLDSILWMATIHKNPGIQSMTRALGNLLRNIAKGTGDRITLGKELSLLQDYIDIQAIRYLDTFEFKNNVPEALYDCQIVKLTLQPLVENAIFHGIEPTGECGVIEVSACIVEDTLILTVEDDGCGIPEERLATLLSDSQHKTKRSLNGIGVANVHLRLQLQYGPQYGLSVESREGEYTRILVRIPVQRGEEGKTDVSSTSGG